MVPNGHRPDPTNNGDVDSATAQNIAPADGQHRRRNGTSAIGLALQNVQCVVDRGSHVPGLRFALPASGTRSLLFRFGDVTFGGVLTSVSGEEFKQGVEPIAATLELWHLESAQIGVGAEFVVLYGGDVGHGVVTPIVIHSQLKNV